MRSPVRQIPLPPASRTLSTLADIEYEDAFLLDAELAPGQTPEGWARDFFAGAPARMRATLPRGWFALGLKLGSADADRLVFGWEVRRSTPQHVLLGAESRIGMPGELLFERCEGGLLFATFLHLGNDAARALWAGVGPVHRKVVRELLEHAATSARQVA